MEALRPNAKRARNAIILVWSVFFIEILRLLSDWLQYNLFQAALNGETVTEASVSANLILQIIVGLLFLIAYIASAVTFIQWFRRAYFNLHLRVDHLAESESAAASAWFIPFVNFFKPYRIMKELYVETDNLYKKELVNYTSRSGTGFVKLWWVVFIADSIVAQFSARVSMKAEGLRELTDATSVSMLNSGITILSAVITVKVIHDYSLQEKLLAGVQEKIIGKNKITAGTFPILPSDHTEQTPG